MSICLELYKMPDMTPLPTSPRWGGDVNDYSVYVQTPAPSGILLTSPPESDTSKNPLLKKTGNFPGASP